MQLAISVLLSDYVTYSRAYAHFVLITELDLEDLV